MIPRAGAGKIITRNGKSCVALIDADRLAYCLAYCDRLEREHHRQLSFDCARLRSSAN